MESVHKVLNYKDDQENVFCHHDYLSAANVGLYGSTAQRTQQASAGAERIT